MTDADTDQTAPLSADELLKLREAATVLPSWHWLGYDIQHNVPNTPERAEAIATILNALPRLLAAAQREAALKQAGDYVATQIRQDANAALRADQPARSKRLGEFAAYWVQIAHGNRLGPKRQAP